MAGFGAVAKRVGKALRDVTSNMEGDDSDGSNGSSSSGANIGRKIGTRVHGILRKGKKKSSGKKPPLEKTMSGGKTVGV